MLSLFGVFVGRVFVCMHRPTWLGYMPLWLCRGTANAGKMQVLKCYADLAARPGPSVPKFNIADVTTIFITSDELRHPN